eukprot:RCo024206
MAALVGGPSPGFVLGPPMGHPMVGFPPAFPHPPVPFSHSPPPHPHPSIGPTSVVDSTTDAVGGPTAAELQWTPRLSQGEILTDDEITERLAAVEAAKSMLLST